MDREIRFETFMRAAVGHKRGKRVIRTQAPHSGFFRQERPFGPHRNRSLPPKLRSLFNGEANNPPKA
jgi:hypothetical protein